MSSARFPVGRGIAALSIVFGLTAGVFGLTQNQKKDDKKPQDPFDAAQRAEIATLVSMTDAAMKGTPAGGAINWVWENNFLKAQDGKTYVPFTLQFDPSITTSMPVTLYVRVVKAGTTEPIPPAPPAGKDDKKKDPKAAAAPTAYPFEDVHFLDLRIEAGKPARLSRAFAVMPGDYDVYVGVKERSTVTAMPGAGANPGNKDGRDAKDAKAAPPPAPAGKSGIAKQTITVPNYWTNEFTTSTIIVADRVEQLKEPLTPQQQMERPYAMGSTEIVPAYDLKFTKAELLSVIFLVYNPSITAGKPDVTIEYTFHQKAPEGEKKFNSTDPQNFNAQTLPPTFDLAAGHQLVAGQEIPLATFPPGDFRLEIKLTDKVSGKSLVRNLNFSVTAS